MPPATRSPHANVQVIPCTTPWCILVFYIDGTTWTCAVYNVCSTLLTWFQSPFPHNCIIDSSNQSLLSESSLRSEEISSLYPRRVAQRVAHSRCIRNGYQRWTWMCSSTPELLNLQRHHLKPEIGSLKQMKGRTIAWHSWLSAYRTH